MRGGLVPEITVATLNLFNRMGNWDSRAPLVIDQCAALAPDILAIQELSLITDQGVWFSREVNERLGGGRYQVKHAASPGKNAAAQGLGVLHRIEPLEHEILDLMTFDCIAQRLVFEAGGRRFVFVNTHLWFPVDGSVARERQIEYLLAWLDARADGLPTIVTGDFNAYAEPPEKTVQIMKARFRSAHEAVHGREPGKTWPTPVNTWDKSPAGTLDYVYVSPEWQVLDAGLCFDRPSPDDPDVYPSDHIGVFAKLSF
jgi:endonuclease/exonuclease/phosphatase family metal-dependent hydrolase